MISNLLMATGSQAPISTVDMVDPFGDGSGIALYKFDGDATDVSGVYNGTASNVTYTDGKFGQCGVFNGGSSKVQLAQEIFESTSGVSVSLWFKTTKNAVDVFDEYIFSKRNGVLTFSIEIYMDGRVEVSNWDSHRLYSTSAKTDGQWHNVIFTFASSTSSTGKLYIDGVLESTYNSIALYTQSFANANAIGCFDGYARWFSGSIDQVRIFNRALTATEVTALYNENVETYVPYVPPQGFFNDGTEVAHYTFDGDVLDSVNNYDGTASNLTYGTGKFGQCGVFNGSNTLIDTGIPQSALTVSSFSVWVYPLSGSSYKGVFGDHYGVFSGIAGFQYAGGISQFMYGTGSTYINGNVSISLNTWTHLVGIITGTGLQIYKNGLHVTSVSGGALSPMGNIFVGRAFAAADRYWNGSIDNFRIFNRALTQEEVTALYNEGQ